MKKQPLKEMLKAIGGGHLLNEKKYPKNIGPTAKKVASQIKSAARGRDTGIFPLKKMAKSISSGIKRGDEAGELKSRLSAADKEDYYVQTSELTGFVVFNPDPVWDGDIFEVWSDEGGDITVAPADDTWKRNIKKHK
tara:strand:+ start:718 stop:1128 length:411 start_codon:yes stop_codon:yes gene_type:complete